MREVDPSTTVLVVPWYERSDFEKLRGMSEGRRFPRKYEDWLDHAFVEMRKILAKGCALKIVTIHLDDYFSWLGNEDEVDSASARIRYIAELAKIGTELPGSLTRTDMPWPGFPAAH
jgi:hypothetical protein